VLDSGQHSLACPVSLVLDSYGQAAISVNGVRAVMDSRRLQSQALYGFERTLGLAIDEKDYEFQATRANCFLRASHSLPERMRGATSIKRGVNLKTAKAVHDLPSRVRSARSLREAAIRA
jgi:hypothetical protein